MSLAVQTEKVEAILLPDGKWYAVAEHSFTVSPYEFQANGDASMKGAPGPLAATWKDNMGKRFLCPMTALLAVRYT
jgi:hypothetical protein